MGNIFGSQAKSLGHGQNHLLMVVMVMGKISTFWVKFLDHKKRKSLWLINKKLWVRDKACARGKKKISRSWARSRAFRIMIQSEATDCNHIPGRTLLTNRRRERLEYSITVLASLRKPKKQNKKSAPPKNNNNKKQTKKQTPSPTTTTKNKKTKKRLFAQ